jgi:hypothetical protein
MLSAFSPQEELSAKEGSVSAVHSREPKAKNPRNKGVLMTANSETPQKTNPL